MYGSDDANTGTQVRDFHREIKGDMPDGSRYHALDPETYYWAHATFVEQVLYFADTFVKRLTDAEKEQIYLESKTWYRRYGVSDRPMPATYAEVSPLLPGDWLPWLLEQCLPPGRTCHALLQAAEETGLPGDLITYQILWLIKYGLLRHRRPA